MKSFITTISSLMLMLNSIAQEVDLFKEADSLNQPTTTYTLATFRSTRIVNAHTVDIIPKGVMDFRILHRFGTLNQGLYDLFGLDLATFRMGFDFGVTDRLMLGVGRSTFQKQYDAFIKYRILRQTTDNQTPISITYLGSIMAQTIKPSVLGYKPTISERLYYSNQLLIARKFSNAFSLQLMPSLVTFNQLNENVFALGAGIKQNINRRISLTSEYFYQFNPLTGTNNSFSIGVDIQTAGHVFQLHFTNSTGMTERSYIAQTNGTWGNGDIHFGFNISRAFTLKKDKTLRTNIR